MPEETPTTLPQNQTPVSVKNVLDLDKKRQDEFKAKNISKLAVHQGDEAQSQDTKSIFVGAYNAADEQLAEVEIPAVTANTNGLMTPAMLTKLNQPDGATKLGVESTTATANWYEGHGIKMELKGDDGTVLDSKSVDFNYQKIQTGVNEGNPVYGWGLKIASTGADGKDLGTVVLAEAASDVNDPTHTEGAPYTATPGLMSEADKIALDLLNKEAGSFVVDITSTTGEAQTLNGLTYYPENITVTDKDGSTANITAVNSLTVGLASKDAFGTVKVGDGINVADGVISVSIPDKPLVMKGVVATKAELPTTGMAEGHMYLVGDATNGYDEYFWTGTAWEILGPFQEGIDMSNYVSKSDFLSDTDFLALFA